MVLATCKTAQFPSYQRPRIVSCSVAFFLFDSMNDHDMVIALKGKIKMKRLIEEVESEGLDCLLGERVLLMCAGYFYEGKLIGVNDSFVKLDDAHIVYSTGTWSDKSYSDIQKLHQKEWYVQRGLIESFGKSKNG